MDRLERYKRSRLSLTEFGKAVLAGDEDFRRHNPIDRWWGGTHLTSERIWRGAARPVRWLHLADVRVIKSIPDLRIDF
ncbi:hypothetical protein [Bradyrhizobium iriomotense]|uniref:hypothetical protein n=1 Tax=Bradyrhizobium iriomotense TaxID=441950 RepID=UPI0024E0BD2E|nr:hypothetical protein [Bradyrhizobium iriomotense]